MTSQQQKKTYTCFVCQKGGHDVQVVLGGRDENNKTIYLQPDGITKHYHIGAKPVAQQPLRQQQQTEQTRTTYDVAQRLEKMQAQLDLLPAISQKLTVLHEIYSDLLEHYKASRKNQEMADAEARYDQDKEDGLA